MPDFYIAPNGTGSGASIDDPAGLGDLSAAIAAAGPGGQVLLIADRGAFNLGTWVTITAGGAEGLPVTVRGIDSSGNPLKAEIVGTRAENWVPGAETGSEAFRLLAGADNLTFQDLTFRNIGNGAIRVGQDIENLTIADVDAVNVQRFVENLASSGATTATIDGLRVSDVTVTGYSKDAFRLQYDTHDVVLENVVLDSQFVDGDKFAIGVHLVGTVHDVLLDRVIARNALDTTNSGYNNGDGFATERGVYRVEFRDTVASGNRDGGYDIKSTQTVLNRAIALENTHNFRFWATDTVANQLISIDPAAHHFGFAKNSVTAINDAVAASGVGTATVFHQADGYSQVVVDGLDLVIDPATRLSLAGRRATLAITDQNDAPSQASGPIDDRSGLADDQLVTGDGIDRTILLGLGHDTVIGGAGREQLFGGGGDDLLVGGAGDDVLTGGSGRDVLIGGAGFDFASYRDGASAVAIDLKHFAAGGAAEGDLIDGIEGLIGTAFADALTGDAAANDLRGLAGADLLEGGDGDDFLEGGADADALFGGAGLDLAVYAEATTGVVIDLASGTASGAEAAGDTLAGIEGVIGSSHDDTLLGDDGANVLVGGGGADALDGRGGIDTADYSASAAAVSVDLAAGTGTGGDAEGDTLAGIERVLGSGFADHLAGSGANEQFYGGDGADLLEGGDGADLLDGGAGADQLFGGGGIDVANYAGNAVGVAASLATGTAAGGEADGDTLAGIEWIVGSAFGDTLQGDGGDNGLVGGGGDDVLLGHGGADVLDGGQGFDIASYADLGGGVTIDLSGTAPTADSYLGIEGILGSDLGDTITAGQGIHWIAGGGGDDTLVATSIQDILIGGSGADQLHGGGVGAVDYSTSSAAVSVDLGTGIGIGGDAEGDRLHEVYRLIGSAFADRLTGDGADNVFGSSAGADVIGGAAGFDTVDYSNSAAAVTVDLGAGIGAGGTAEGDALQGIEAIIGTGFDDRLTGDGADNLFFGGDGNDAIDGAGGIDTVDYSDSATAVVVDLGLGTGTSGSGAVDTLTSIERVTGTALADSLTGDAADNVLVGAAGNDVLNGGLGGDTLIGGGGDDTYVVDSPGDQVIELPGEGVDLVQVSADSFTLSADLEDLQYIGTGVFLGFGNDSANRLTGGEGSETFYGFGGDDRFFGSLGADTFYGGAGSNVASYTASDAVDLDLATQENHGGHAEGDRLYEVTTFNLSNFGDIARGADGADVFYGRGGSDTLYGRAGNDKLDGGVGDDIVYGGLGDDMLVVDSLNDVTVEYAGEGMDTVTSRIGEWTLADNIENLIATSTVAIVGTGNGLDNIITGSAHDDVISGLDGNDVLAGRAGADAIDGGAGSDTADYLTSFAGVSIDLEQGIVDGGDAAGDVLLGIENLSGSALADRLVGDDGANVLSGNAGNDFLDGGNGDDTLAGGFGGDVFAFDNAHASGHDTIADFGQADVLRFSRALADSNRDGLIDFKGSVIRIDGTTTGDTVTMLGVKETYRLRFMGSDADGSYYADASVRPQELASLKVYEGRIGDDVLAPAETAGVSRVFFFDTGAALNVGHDRIVDLDDDDIVVTTSALVRQADGVTVLAGADGAFDLGRGDSLQVGRDGAALTQLEYDGVQNRNGVNYFVYSVTGSAAGLGNLVTGSIQTREVLGDAGDNRLVGKAGTDVFTGGGGSDTFLIDSAGSSGNDTITDFGADDALLLTKRLPDTDGITRIIKSVVHLEVGVAADSVTLAGVPSTYPLRYLGQDAGGHYYGQASVRPVAGLGEQVIEGTVGDELFARDPLAPLAKDVYFFDNGGAAPTGNDTIADLTLLDEIVTTREIGVPDATGNVAGSGGTFDLGNGGTLHLDVDWLHYAGSEQHGGVTYHTYGIADLLL